MRASVCVLVLVLVAGAWAYGPGGPAPQVPEVISKWSANVQYLRPNLGNASMIYMDAGQRAMRIDEADGDEIARSTLILYNSGFTYTWDSTGCTYSNGTSDDYADVSLFSFEWTPFARYRGSVAPDRDHGKSCDLFVLQDGLQDLSIKSAAACFHGNTPVYLKTFDDPLNMNTFVAFLNFKRGFPAGIFNPPANCNEL